MESPTKAKQLFLRTEIIDGGYDPIDFTEYLEEIKNDGSNLDNWTLEELQSAVMKFKEDNGKNGENQHHSDSGDSEPEEQEHGEEEEFEKVHDMEEVDNQISETDTQ